MGIFDWFMEDKDISPKKHIKNNLIGIGVFSAIVIISVLFFHYNFCNDGTFNNRCSNNQPLYCFKGELIENSSFCRCPGDYKAQGEGCIKIQRCSDETVYGKCSKQKPLFCLEGDLINKSSRCGCQEGDISIKETCISKYLVDPKMVNFVFTLHGNYSSIQYTVYGGLNDYISTIPRKIYYDTEDEEPDTKAFILKNIDNSEQSLFINKLVEEIKTISNNSDDQARIAISLVQNIPFDDPQDRYAYQVLYDGKGYGAYEKSQLLVFLLRELGYGTALIEYGDTIEITTSENIPYISYDENSVRSEKNWTRPIIETRYNGFNYEIVGIKCPDQYSYRNSGYCFIDASVPSIITDSQGDYPDPSCETYYSDPCTQKLPTEYSLIKISDGKSFDSVSEEYKLANLN